MDYKQKYEQWLKDDCFDADTKKELEAIADNDKEIKERFYKDLEFGTGGLRGIIGAGTNRMNIYTVGKASQGLANYILAQGEKKKKWGLPLPLTLEICLLNLHKQQGLSWRPTVFVLTYTLLYALRQCFLLPFVI